MTQRKSWATLELKAVDAAKRTFEAIASTPTPDRMEDVVDPMGAQFKLPIPFLYQHDSSQPVGWITEATPTKKGIRVKGNLAQVEGPPSLKERLDVAWSEMVSGLVRGVSIGFISKLSEPIKDSYGYLIKEWEWLELSMVTIPANAEASITSIKSIDERQRAALGPNAAPTAKDAITTPGASGHPVVHLNQGTKVKTMAEQIAGFEAARAAKTARMTEIMNKAADEGRTLDAAETEEYDNLDAEVKSGDTHLTRLRAHEKTMATTATPVTEDKSTAANGSQQRVPVILHGKSNLPKGTGLTRYACAMARSKGNIQQAMNFAKQWKDSTPEVFNALEYASMEGPDFFEKSAIAAGDTTTTAWAAPLVQYTNMAAEFVELLYPLTILGRLNGLRRVPFNIRFPTQTAGATVGWVGQGLGKPVSKLQFTTTTLGFAKAAGIVVITSELAKLSSPSAELLVRTDLLNTMAKFEDQQFIDPSVIAVANVNPAAVTNGATKVTSTGVTRALVDADFSNLLSGFLTANIALGGAYWIMTPYNALKLSLLREANGQPSYPDITAQGGMFNGFPVLTSNNVPTSVSGGSIIVFMVPSEIFLSDEGGVQIDASEEASIQMDSAPSQTSSNPTTLVSLWQNNLIGIRAERMINWAPRRTAAIAYIDATYY